MAKGGKQRTWAVTTAFNFTISSINHPQSHNSLPITSLHPAAVFLAFIHHLSSTFLQETSFCLYHSALQVKNSGVSLICLDQRGKAESVGGNLGHNHALQSSPQKPVLRALSWVCQQKDISWEMKAGLCPLVIPSFSKPLLPFLFWLYPLSLPTYMILPCPRNTCLNHTAPPNLPASSICFHILKVFSRYWPKE